MSDQKIDRLTELFTDTTRELAAYTERSDQLSGELARLSAAIEKLEDKIERNLPHKIQIESLDRRMTKIEGWHSWATKIIIALIITAGMGLIVKTGLLT